MEGSTLHTVLHSKAVTYIVLTICVIVVIAYVTHKFGVEDTKKIIKE